MLERLLDILLPNGGYAMAVVEAYFDESGTHDGSPFLCVAGYIFEKEKAIALDAEWRKMLAKYRLPYFHMKECAHNRGVFKHLTMQECDLAAREAIALTKTYAERGIALSLDMDAYPLIPNDGVFSTPYSWLCWQVFNGIKKWADEKQHLGGIACMFELGANGSGNLLSATANIFKIPMLKDSFRGKGITFIDKNDAAALQCADLLAWHWHTHQKRLQKGLKIRKDFKSLVALNNVDAHHYDKKAVEFLISMKHKRLVGKFIHEAYSQGLLKIADSN